MYLLCFSNSSMFRNHWGVCENEVLILQVWGEPDILSISMQALEDAGLALSTCTLSRAGQMTPWRCKQQTPLRGELCRTNNKMFFATNKLQERKEIKRVLRDVLTNHNG